MASTLKEQTTATSMLVDAKVWADSPTVASAIEPVTAPGLKRTAAGVWRSIVEGVRSTFSSDLDAAQSLVQATLNRATATSKSTQGKLSRGLQTAAGGSRGTIRITLGGIFQDLQQFA